MGRTPSSARSPLAPLLAYEPIAQLLLESVSRPTHIRLSLLVTTALAFSATPPEAELPRDVILAHDIRVHMTAELKRVINYTCLETISRGKRAPDRLVIAVPGKSVPFRRTDSIRLEVAELDHKEMFAHPGEHRFDDRDIMDFGIGGMIGNGVFTGFANDIFRSGASTYKWIGEEQVKGRKLLHFVEMKIVFGRAESFWPAWLTLTALCSPLGWFGDECYEKVGLFPLDLEHAGDWYLVVSHGFVLRCCLFRRADGLLEESCRDHDRLVSPRRCQHLGRRGTRSPLARQPAGRTGRRTCPTLGLSRGAGRPGTSCPANGTGW